jgi:hypothetical protein
MSDASFTQLSVPLARKSSNFAPRKPLENLLRDKKPSKNPTKFEAAFRTWYSAKMAYESATWQNLYATAQLVAYYRAGEFLLQRRPAAYGGGYYVRPNTQDDNYKKLAMNLMMFHSQVCEAKILASNPSVNMRAADDTPQAIAAAQACRPIVDCYETEWYTNKWSRREALDFLTNGMIIGEVRWNPFKGGQSVQSRQVSQIQKQTDNGYGECAMCQFTGDAQDFPEAENCPECGSDAVDVKPPTMINMSQIGMGQPIPVGEPELIRSPLQGWRWELSKDLEDSPWAIKRQRVTQGAINLMIGGDVIIPDSQSSDDYGLQILHALSYSGQAYGGSSNRGMYGGGNRDNDHRPTMAECWLSPEDCAEIDVDETETICGQSIPKGKLSDFAQGQPVCVVALNDGQAIVGVYRGESHQNQVYTGQWIMQSESGAGRGMEDTAQVAQRFNSADGQIYQGLAATATPAAITDMSLFKEDQANYLFRPGVNIDVNLALLPPNTKLSDAFFVPNAGNVNQQYINYSSSFLRQMAQITSFATEFTDGLIGVDNRTATGAQITAALANSLYAPMLGTKGQTRVRIAQMIVSLVQKHSVAGRYYAGKGNAKGRMVSGQDLKGNVVFELVANSELPVTPFSQQTDIRVMVESLGGPEGLLMIKKQEPEMFEQLSAPFNYKPEVDLVDQVSTLCLTRLEQFKQGLNAGIDDPVMLVDNLKPPISAYEPHMREKQIWASNFLDLQQGQEAPLVIRQAVEQMWVRLETLNTQREMPVAANQGMIQGAQIAAEQAPSALGQMALQGAQGGGDPSQAAEQQHEHAQNQHDREAEAASQLSEQQHEAQLKQMELQGQENITRLQGENAVRSAEVAGENALKVQRAKPKPKKPAAAA